METQKVRPWYPFYPSDYQRDTKFLSPMADLVYRRLLDLYWMNQGPIPLNYAAIGRAIGLDTRVVKRYLHGELKVFWLTSDALLSNARMDKEITKCEEKQQHLAIAGRKGGLAKAKANAVANEQARPQPQPQEKETPPSGVQRKKKLNGKFKPPTLQEVRDYILERGVDVDPDKFFNHYASVNWFRGKTKISNWKLCVNTWVQKPDNETSYGNGGI